MAKIFVEDTEIKIWEKTNVEQGNHQIKGNFYIMDSVAKTSFKSTIFFYDEISVLISKIKRFNEDYFKVVLFNDAISKAWQLIIFSCKLNTKIKRLSNDVFLVVGESKNKDVVSQVSFCKLKPSTAVEEITLNFTKLVDLQLIGENSILICYDDAESPDDVLHCLSMYNYEGKLLKNFYEYYDSDDTKYSYKIEDNKLKIVKI